MAPDEFRSIREKLGLTQAELAAHFGVALRTISNIESGGSPKFRLYALALSGLDAEQRSAEPGSAGAGPDHAKSSQSAGAAGPGSDPARSIGNASSPEIARNGT